MTGPIETNVSSDTPAGPNPSYQANSISVGTTATLICVVPGGFEVTLYSTAAVHIGAAGVTASSGFPLPAATVLPVPGGYEGERALYGIVASGTATVSYIFAAQ